MQACTSKQSPTPHTQSLIPPENGSLQGEKRTKRQTHTERVSAGNRWKLALIALLTSDPEVKRYGSAHKANTPMRSFLFCFLRAHFYPSAFCGKVQLSGHCVCIEGHGVTSHHMQVRITTSWIHFDVRETEGRQRREFQGPASGFVLKT